MEKQTTIIIDRIKRSYRIRKYTALMCITIIVLGLVAFVVYGVTSKTNAVKFISKGKNSYMKVEKVMVNPKIKFEQTDNQIYDIDAKKAVHIDDNNIELFDVTAVGASGNIKAGRLLVSNKGNNLHFSDNPVLTIIETKNE